MIEAGKVLQQRYRIERQIGQGGMGAVYIATDERFGSIVAIKETLFMDANYRKAIDREARLLNSLKHVALPRVSDHFIEENGQFIVMEYISGEDLGHVLEENNKPFPVEQVMTWADQLLDALDFLHNQAHPVIHRDIKPQNLKVAPNGQIILLDFGLAKGNPTDAGHQTAAKSIFGYSRNYASLEQIQGTGTDPRSDLYSLAATLYHLLTNSPPEDALTRAMAVLSRKHDPLVPVNQVVENIPSGIAYVLQRALDLDAAGRPASASVMRTMLREHEKYESQAPTVVGQGLAAAANIHAHETRIMPGSTVGSQGWQTDVKTELMGVPHSDGATGTRVVSQPVLVPMRRFGMGAVAVIVLLLAGTIAGGTFLFYPELFGASRPPQPPMVEPVITEVKTVATDANANAAASIGQTTDTTTNSVDNSYTSPSNTAVAKDSTKPTRGSGTNSPTQARKPNEVVVDGETVYIGNTKITDDKIETPDGVMDTNGFTPNVPNPPNRGRQMVVIPPPDLSHLTPEQKKKVLRAMRRHGVIVRRPSPSPPPEQ